MVFSVLIAFTSMVMAMPNFPLFYITMLKLPEDKCGGTCKVGPHAIGCSSECYCSVEWAGYGSCKNK
ncbi:unnamed protein product [Rotaria socialis]|uniref:Uncharacterized protein n=1 Tax=Rotaria socialis TaxID=392032 RepID=A0A818QB39_9BILA|nr:unnamed protein product [Rotaria socialis]